MVGKEEQLKDKLDVFIHPCQLLISFSFLCLENMKASVTA